MRRLRVEPPDALTGLPRLVVTPISTFFEAGLADPICSKIHVIRSAYYDLSALSRARCDALPESNRTTERYQVLTTAGNHIFSLREYSSVYSRKARWVGLARLLDSTASFREIVEIARLSLAEIARELDVAPEHRKYLLDEAELALDELLSTLSSTIPEQLALQTHLEYFIAEGMPDTDEFQVAKAVELYGPLFSLRNDYFASPKRGTLREYLKLVSDVEASFAYESLVDEKSVRLSRGFSFTDHRDLLISRAALLKDAVEQLEVLALLDEATLVDERDAHVSA